MRNLICLTLLLLAATASAADLSGKWTGTVDVTSPDGSARQLSVVLQLRQKGAELSGTIADANGNEVNIANAALEGSTITFEVKQGDNGPLWKVKLTASDDALSGEATTAWSGQSMKGRMNLKRAAS